MPAIKQGGGLQYFASLRIPRTTTGDGADYVESVGEAGGDGEGSLGVKKISGFQGSKAGGFGGKAEEVGGHHHWVRAWSVELERRVGQIVNRANDPFMKLPFSWQPMSSLSTTGIP